MAREADARFERAYVNPLFRAALRDRREARAEPLPVDERFARFDGGHVPARDTAPGAVDIRGAHLGDAQLLDSDADYEEDDVESEASSATDARPSGLPAAPLSRQATSRLAMVNFDWENFRAVDILLLMRSLAPAGGQVRRVTIYPTELGMSKLPAERRYGPIWDGPGVPKSATSGAEEQEQEQEDDGLPKSEAEQKRLAAQYMERARQYELQRLLYHFAVIECDDSSTASALYEAVDGLEYADSANIIDLRFIPDDMHDFETRAPYDRAEEVPPHHQPQRFSTLALQHTVVRSSWDADDRKRAEKLRRRRFTEDELRDDDFKAYIASCSEDEVERGGDAGAWARAYKAQLLQQEPRRETEADERDSLGDSDADGHDGGGDREYTYDASLVDAGAKILDAAQRRGQQLNESAWEARLRRAQERKREKKRLRKLRLQEHHETEQRSDTEATPVIDDPFFAEAPSLASPRRERAAPAGRPRANAPDALHRIAAEIHASAFHAESSGSRSNSTSNDEERYARRRSVRSPGHERQARDDVEANGGEEVGKRKRRKRQCRQPAAGEAAHVSRFEADDPRFAALYESHEYAIDPTHPHFKRSRDAHHVVARKRHEKRQRARTEHTAAVP